MSIFRTNTTIFHKDIYSNTSDINIRTQGIDLKIDLNGNHILSDGDVKLKNVYLLDENDGATYKKLYNDDTTLFWGDKSVLVDDDDIVVNDITFSGNLKIGDITYQLPSELGNEGQALKTHADGSLYWGAALGSLAELDGVNIVDPQNNDVLTYQSGEWINSSSLSNLTITNSTIDDTNIGQTIAASGKFTSLESLSLQVDNDATINGDINLDGDLNIVGNVKDANNNELVEFVTTTDAVNNIKITNNVTGSNPIVSASGDDLNIGLDFQVIGDASYNFLGTSDTATVINLFENTTNGDNKISLKAPEEITSDITFTLPGDTGVDGQVLKTDGNGVMSWVDSLTIDNEGDDRIITSNGAGGIYAESSLTFDGTDLNVYKAVDSGNPSFNIGSSFAESLSVQSVYSGGGQTLEYVTFNTRTNQTDPDKGAMIFSVNDNAIFTVIDSGINLTSGKKLLIDSEEILSNYAGVTSLKNIQDLDNTTKSTIKSVIDELPNLTSASLLATVGTIATGVWEATPVEVPFGGTGATTFSTNGILLGNGTDPVTSSDSLSFDGSILSVEGDIQMFGSLIDQNGNEIIQNAFATDAINQFTISNAATGNNPSLSASGDDPNIGFDFNVKGDGTYNFKATNDAATTLVLYNKATNGTNSVSVTVPNLVTNSYDLTLPVDAGANGQVLITDGTGVTSWTDKPSLSNDVANAVVVSTGDGNVEGTNMTFDNINLNVYNADDDSNPSMSIGSSDTERIIVQSIYDTGDNTLDKVVIATKTQSGTANKGKIEVNVDDVLEVTIDDAGMMVREEGNFRLGTDVVLSQSSGTVTLSNISAIDATTQSTIETTVTSLPNLTSASSLETVGTITTGVWEGTPVDVSYGGTGATSFTANELLIGNGASQLTTNSNLTFNGSVLGVNADVNLSGSIKDYLFGNELLKFNSTGANAVNEITIGNNTTGNNPTINATGNDPNLGLDFQAKGTGKYNFKSTSAASSEIVLFEDTDNGSNTVSIKAPASLTGSFTLTLPGDDGGVDQILKTDGSGNLSWADQNTLNISSAGNNRITTSDGSTGLVGESNLLFDGTNFSQYVATNDANPSQSLGSGVNETLVIQSIYDTGAQTLDKVTFTSKATSATADKGKFEFYVDDALTTTFNDAGIMIKTSGTLAFGGVSILTDSAGTTTLNNIDALDATTETTIENAIDTLPNLTSASSLATIGTVTSGTWNGSTVGVQYGGTGATTFTSGGILLGNTTSALSASSALTYNSSILNLAASSKIAIGSVNIIDDTTGTTTLSNIDALDATTETTIENAIDTLNNLTSASSLATVGTITSGTWQGSVIAPTYGGTGVSSLSSISTLSGLTSIGTIGTGVWQGTAIGVTYGGTGQTSLANNSLLTGNGTSGIVAESNLTFDGTTLGLTGNINMSGNINDVNSNELLKFTTTTNAVNEFTITNAATGNNPLLSATGGDTNLDIELQAKGTGKYKFRSTSAQSTELVFYEDTDNGSNTVSIKAPASVGTSYTLTLPDTDGNVDQILKTDGDGILSWVDQSTSLNITNEGNNRLTTSDGAGGLVGESNLTFDGINLEQYNASDDGNPAYCLGASSTERLVIQSIYDGGTQNLDKIIFTSQTASGTANKGKFEFNVDDTNILTIVDAGLVIKNDGSLTIGSRTILDEDSGTITLSNIDALDVTTASTISNWIVTMPNLTSAETLATIGTITSGTWNGSVIDETYGGTGVTSLSSITSLSGLATVGTITSGTWNGSVIDETYGGTGVTSLNDITSLSSLATVGTITSGTWNGTVIDETYGGTGVTSLNDITSLSSLSTVGTIAFGTWNGSVIDETYGGTGVSSLSSITSLSGLATVGTVTFGTWNADIIGETYGGTGVSSLSSITSLSGLATVGTVTFGTWNADVIGEMYGGTGVSSLSSITSLSGLDTVGTITNGTWNANIIDESYGGTGVTSLNDITSLSSLATVGTITVGTWNGDVIGETYGGTGVSSLSSITALSGLDTVGTITSGTWNGSVIDETYGGTGVTSLSSITTLSGLTSIGTIGTGVWQGTAVDVSYGGTGQTSLTSDSLLTGNGTSGIVAESTLKYTGTDMTQYVTTNDANPTTSLGSGANERLVIQSVYDTGAQTLDKVTFTSKANSATADKGKMEFYVDDALVSTFNDAGIMVKASGTLAFGGVSILSDSAGTTTLSNIDAIDATTETTIENAIDTLPNLTSATSLASIGTVTTGTWNGSTVGVAYGGTGQTSLTNDSLLTGNGTSGIVAESNLTFSGTDLTIKAAGKLKLNDSDNSDAVSLSAPASATAYNAILPASAGLVGQSMIVTGVAGSDMSLGFGTPTYGYSTISTNTNAVVNVVYLCNTSGGTFTVTLPSAPAVGSVISFIDSTSSFSTNNLVVARGGSDVMYVNTATASATSIAVGANNTKITCEYVASGRWNVNYPYVTGMKIAVLKDVKAKSTDGGAASAGTWLTRTLNTATDPDNIAPISSNQFTLAPGKYYIECSCPSFLSSRNKIALMDSSGNLIAMGTSEWGNTTGPSVRSYVHTVININSATTYTIKHNVGTVANTNDLGVYTGINDPNGTNASEIYTTIVIMKYDITSITGIASLLTTYNRTTINSTTNPLVVNTIYSCDTSGSAFSVTLPSIAPVQGDYIELVDSTGSFGTNNLTITAAGAYMYANSNSAASSSLVISITNAKVKCTYVANNRWCIEYQNAIGVKVAVLWDEQTGTTDGAAITNGAVWTQRVLNKESDPDGIVTLSGGTTGVGGTANAFTLNPGKYLISASIPSSQVAFYKTLLMSGSTVIATGTVEYSGAANTVVPSTRSFIETVVNISTATTYSIKHTIQTTPGWAGGRAYNVNDPNATATVNVYTLLTITKYDDPISSGVVSVLSAYNRATISTTTNPLVVNTIYTCDTSGAGFTVTLPSSAPAQGDYIELIDSTGSFGTNNLTIATDGSHQMYVNTSNTGATSLVVTANNTRIKCIYVATNRWCIEYQNAIGVKYAILRDEQAKGTAGGTNTATAWTTRTINTEYDPDGIVSIASNQFTLIPGKYYIECKAPMHKVVGYKIALYTSGGTLVCMGTSENTDSSDNTQTSSYIHTLLNISTATTYLVRYYAAAAYSTYGQGVSTILTGINDANSVPAIEVYTVISIAKYDDPVTTNVSSLLNYYSRATISTTLNPLVVNTIYSCNTSGGGFTVTLPSSAPVQGDYIELIDSTGSFGTGNLTIATGGSNQMYVNTSNTGATALVVTANNARIKCVYANTNRWCIEYQNVIGVKVATITDTKVANAAADGGVALVVATWTPRVLNTLVDPDGIISGTFVASAYPSGTPTGYNNTNFTLQPGKYEIYAISPGFRTNGHNISLYNVTTSAYVDYGNWGHSGSADTCVTNVEMTVRVTISTATTYQIRFYAGAVSDRPLGIPLNISPGEIYTRVTVTKYDDPITSNVSSLLNYYNRATISTTTSPLVVNTIYSCNTSGGAFTVTLPSSAPAQGDYIELIDSTGSFGTYNLTIATGGSNQMYVNTSNTGATSLVITANNAKIKCTYTASNRWCIEYQNAVGVKIAILKDQRSNATAPDSSSAGTFSTRTLNTIQDPDGITSISSNRFTLSPGKYKIDFFTNSYYHNNNVAAIYRVSPSAGYVNELISTNARTQQAGNDNIGTNVGSGLLIITQTSVYELRHWVQTSTSGFGQAASDSASLDEVYAIITITKYDDPITSNVSSLLNYYNRDTISTTTNPLAVNTIYSCNTSGGAFTVTLPSAAPAQGDYIELLDSTGSFGTYNLTIATGGSNQMYVNTSNTGATSLVITANNAKIRCTYAASNRWCVEYQNAIGVKIALLVDEKAANAQSGAPTATTWNTRTITVKYDPDGIVSIVSGGSTSYPNGGVGDRAATTNQFTLQPGKYSIEASCAQYSAQQNKLCLVTSGGTVVAIGMSSWDINSGNAGGANPELSALLNISTATTYLLKHYVTTNAGADGQGIRTGSINDPTGVTLAPEVFARIRITKYDDPITFNVSSLLNYYSRATISTTLNPLVVNTIYSCNTSGGGFTVTLPSAAPAQGDYIELIDSTGSFGTSNLTIATGGSNQMYVNTSNTGATSLVITANNAKIRCTYVANNRWCIEYQNALGVKYAVLKEEQAKGTNAGTTVASAWTNRTINTEYDPDGIVSVSANQFTLVPGKYYIECRSPFLKGASTKTALYTAAGALVSMGSSIYMDNVNDNSESDSFVNTIINISTATAYVLKYYASVSYTSVGLGVYTNINDVSGAPSAEVYATITITKYDDPITTNVSSLLAYYNRATISTTLNPLVSNTIYSCDTSGAGFTVTLPSAAPAQGDYIELIDSTGSFGTNNLTIVTGASNLMYVNGNTTGFSTLVASSPNSKVRCTYTNTNRWCIEYPMMGGIQCAVLRDEKAKNTAAGTPVSGWNQRVINTEYDPDGIVSLSGGTTGLGGTANLFTLGPGRYIIEVIAPLAGTNHHKIALMDSSNNLICMGSSEFNYSTGGGTVYCSTISYLSKPVDISTATTYKIQHYSTGNYNNMGHVTGVNDPNGTSAVEVYTTVKIMRYDSIVTAGIVSVLNTYSRATISTTTNPLVVNTIYSCNTSGGGFTVTLPSSAPAQGDYIELIDSTGSFGTSNLTIVTGGSNQMYVNTSNTGATSLVVTANNAKIKCTYVATNRWCVEYQNAVGVKMAILREETAYSVDPGASATGAGVQRTISAEDDPDGIVSFASNRFTLNPGKYFVQASCPAYASNQHRVFLMDYNGGGTPIFVSSGSSHYTNNYVTNSSNVAVTITISTATTYYLQHKFVTAQASNGLGVSAALTDPNGVSRNNVFTQIIITKYDDPITSNIVSVLNAYNKANLTVADNNIVLSTNTIYTCDTTGGTFNVVLPSSAAAGDYIEIYDGLGNFAIANLTMSCNNASHRMYVSRNTTARTSLTFTQANMNMKIVYTASNRWMVNYDSAGGIKIAVIKDVKTKNTNGGTSTTTTWTTKTLNTTTDPDGIVSLSGGTTGKDGTATQFTLAPGKYYIECSSPAFQSAQHKVVLMDTSNNMISMGTSEWTTNASNHAQTRSYVHTVFSISTATTYKIQHQVLSGNGTNGLGVTTNINDPNSVSADEIYSTVIVMKYDEPTNQGVVSLLTQYDKLNISTTTNPLVVNTIYSCNTSGGAFTVTLPSSPAQGDYIELIDSTGSFGTSNLTIATGGSNQMYVNTSNTGSTSLVVTANNARIKCVYANTNRWCVEYQNAIGVKIALIKEEMTKNTNPGSAAAGWSARIMNNKYDPDGIVTLSGGTTGVSGTANQFTLAPGKYCIDASSPAFGSGRHKIELRTSTGTLVQMGTCEYLTSSQHATTSSKISALVSISTSTIYKINHYFEGTGGGSFQKGVDTNANDSAGISAVEVYTDIKITKYDDPITSNVSSLLNYYNRATISTTTNPLVVNTIYSCNTSGGAFTVTLPSSAPAQGDYIELIDSTGSFGTYNLTIATGGSNQMYVNSNTTGSTSLVIGITNCNIKCTYVASNRWCIEYINATGIKFAILRDEKVKNTYGGNSVAGGWNTRTINTEYDPHNIVSLTNGTTGVGGTANQFILNPGNYLINVKSPVEQVRYHRAELYNITTSTPVACGIVNFTNAASDDQSAESTIDYILQVTTATTYSIKVYTSQSPNLGVYALGGALNINNSSGTDTSANYEIYTTVQITKYDDPITSGVVSVMNTYNRATISTTTNPLVVNTIYSCDTSGGGFTVTLPSAAPAQGDYIELIDATGSFGTSNLTIATGGSNQMYVNTSNTGATSLVVTANNARIKCVYAATNRWCIEYQNAIGVKVAVLREEQAYDTNGGTATAGSWQTRTINTESDPDGIVSLSANQFTLAPGKYLIRANCPFMQTNSAQIALYNSANTLIALGTSDNASSSDTTHSRSFLEHPLSISTTTSYLIKYQVQTTSSTNGLGVRTNLIAGINNVYAIITIMKYDDPITSNVSSLLNYYNRATIATTTNPLVVNTIYSCDTSGGGFTVTLPSSAPAQGDYIELIDSTGSFGTSNLTIATGGSNQMYVNTSNTGSTSLVVTANNARIKCVYANTNRWCIEYQNAIGVKYAILRDEQTKSTVGGTNVASAWTTRTINTEYDPDGIVSISSNQFTLIPGKYFVECRSPFYRSDRTKIALHTSGGTLVSMGSSEYPHADATQSNGYISVILNISTATTYVVKYIAQSVVATYGLGVETNVNDANATPAVEIYTIINITKYDDPITSNVSSLLNYYNRATISTTTNPLVVNTIYSCNTTNGAFTVTLPSAAPAQGDYIELIDSAGSFATNNLTLAAAGSYIFVNGNAANGTSSLIIGIPNSKLKCTYAANNRWHVEYPNAIGMKIALLKEEQAKNVKGNTGSTLSTSTWNVRVINTEYDPDSIVSVSSNQFTLGPGKYLIESRSPSYRSDRNKSALYTSGGTLVSMGSSGFSNGSTMDFSFISVLQNITTSTTYTIKHWLASAADPTFVFGVETNINDANGAAAVEVYADIKITKYDDPTQTGIASLLGYYSRTTISSTTNPLVVNTIYSCNTSGGAFTVTLPSAAPIQGDYIELIDSTGSFAANNLTVVAAGAYMFVNSNTTGASSLVVGITNCKIKCTYVASNRWCLEYQNATGVKVAVIKDVKVKNTAAATVSTGWVTREINAESDPDNIVSISANQFTLQPGKYSIDAFTNGYRLGSHKLAMYDSNSNLICMGLATYCYEPSNVSNASIVKHAFTISSTTTYKFSHYASNATTAAYGNGVNVNDILGNSSDEVYIMATITKYDDPITSGVNALMAYYNRSTITTTTNPLVVNTIYSCNTSAGAFTVTLPLVASQGDYIELIDSTGSFATNNLTLAAGGAYIFANSSATGANSLVIAITNCKVKCTYVAAFRWCVEYINATGIKMAVLKDEQAKGTHGGTSIGATWTTRVINTEYDPDNIVSISSNQFTLNPGKYHIECRTPVLRSDTFKTALHTSTGTLVSTGTSELSAAADNTITNGYISVLLNISATTTYVLKYYIATAYATYGLGAGLNTNDANGVASPEVYTTINITKYDDPISSGVVAVMNTYNRLTISTTTNPLIANTIYSVNTSAGAFTVTLPPSPSQGDYIELIDANGTFATYNLTIAAAGAYIFANSQTTGATSLVIGITNSKIKCTYVNTNRWCLEYQNATGVKVAVIREERAKGTNGGTSSSTTWHTRTLNVKYDPHNIVSIVSGGSTAYLNNGVGDRTANTNQFTLQPGNYYIKASSTGMQTDYHKLALFTSTGTCVLHGTSEYGYGATGVTSPARSYIDAVLQVSSTTTYQIKHYIAIGRSNDGLGVRTNVTDPNAIDAAEVYATVEIMKYDDPISSGVVSVLNTYNRVTIATTTNPLAVNTIYTVNTTSSAFTVTLPSTALSLGDYIELIDANGTFGTNNLTISAAGAYMFVNTNTVGASSLIVTGNNAKIRCTYANTNRWCIEYPNAIGMKVAVLRDEKARNGLSGTSVAATWNTRTITVKYDPDGIVSIVSGGATSYPNGGVGDRTASTNQFTLNPGKYLIKASSPSFASTHNKISLVTSTGTVVAIGTNDWNNNASIYAVTVSTLEIPVTISTATTYLIRHYITSARASDGLGTVTNLADPAGADAYEVFANVTIIKYDDPISTGIVSVLPSAYSNKLAITGSLTLAVNTYYYITSSGTYTLTLPSAPSLGDMIEITDGTGALASNVSTVTRAGSQNILIGDVSVTSFAMNKNGMKCKLEYVNTNRWAMTTSTNEGIWSADVAGPSWLATTTPPTMPSVINLNKFNYTIIGKTMYLRYDFYANATTGAAAGSGVYIFPIPTGFTIASSVPTFNNATYGSGSRNLSSVGVGITSTGASNNTSALSMVVYNSTSLIALAANTGYGVTGLGGPYIGSGTNDLTQTKYALSYSVTLPLA